MKPLLLLPLALLASPGCSNSAPYVTTVGILKPGSTLTVRVADAPVNVYGPTAGQPGELFTVAATALRKGAPPPAPRLRPRRNGLLVDAPKALASLLVRVPKDSDLSVVSMIGDVNVTDIGGAAQIVAGNGNVKVMLNGYAQVQVGRGNLSVTMGALHWPGTLHFATRRGDIEVWIDPRVACTVHLHTENGTLFTDFALRGTSSGASETIDGMLNGGGPQRIDIDAGNGAIRLLRLQPQA